MNSFYKVFAGVLIGILALTVTRFLFMPMPEVTHFHANFAMFVDGQRIDLTDDKYMEDVQGCKADYVKITPEERTHMHENNHDVVHIHDDGVTWGHFMSNIGFAFGENYLIDDENMMYRNEPGKTMKFILNGTQVANPFNKLIGSEDRLLISFGSESLEEVMNAQFSVVASDAHEHNEHPDPGSCSGSLELGLKDRLWKALWY